jgi:chitin synthase
MSGLGVVLERHPKDNSILVQAQVISRPIRQPTPISLPDGSLPSEEHPELDVAKTHPVTTQLNYILSQVFANLDRTNHWTIRPSDSGSPTLSTNAGSRPRSERCCYLIPSLGSNEFLVDYDHANFCE